MDKNAIINFLTYLKSAETAQTYLAGCYQKLELEDPEANSYQNCYRFLYYLEHGHTFYETSRNAPLMIKPILLFYGMVHLLKACLLTRRPGYPENTALLAHGVSTRKRKKQQYSFMKDEVKIQHNGLFPYFSENLFHIDPRKAGKISMKSLFAKIPEMNRLFSYHFNDCPLIKIGSIKDKQLAFPLTCLDTYHATAGSFQTKISNYFPDFQHSRTTNKQLIIDIAEEISPISKGPAFVHWEEEAIYFPSNRYYFTDWHEVMAHYLLLYNLGMICRYETEWWGDLLHTLPNEDYPFIYHFLQTTAEKAPNLLGCFLFNQKNKDL
ncbi:YaaC family protein [Sediminibacillus albus]|uniref:YaaC-like Protein n=1 Tax=Sediminibacillus albus TaxID=407036 RepID=A0A1G9AA63_9BACI|nr:YaaC family protein [Sediminibacillus albus]SDK23340.1 YaaC-like Protein [Sediminibacillus albus]